MALVSKFPISREKMKYESVLQPPLRLGQSEPSGESVESLDACACTVILFSVVAASPAQITGATGSGDIQRGQRAKAWGLTKMEVIKSLDHPACYSFRVTPLRRFRSRKSGPLSLERGRSHAENAGFDETTKKGGIRY
ncbi:hypothetical protein H4582DRAFT_2053885 [Lactarius indigo]|nr:hypothetical protein H4582DRAFT_2053885 [Lactarius indigo]